MNATVNLQLDEFQALMKAKEDAERTVNEQREQMKQMKIEASDATLRAAARAGIEVTRFAVAHLTPEVIQGWPYEALRTIAESLPAFPDVITDDHDLATTLRTFAQECEVFEQRRRVLGMYATAKPKKAEVATEDRDPVE